MDIELDEMNFNNLDYGALGRIRIGSMALSTLISAVLTFITCFIVMQIILKTLERILGRANKIDGTLKGFIHSAVKIVLWILTGIIVAGALGIPTTSLVALISIAGLALSLSVQNILSTVDGGEQYIETEDGIEGVVDNLDKLSLLFNILTVDFSRDLTICEGPIDSMFINNCIALCGASKLNNYFDDIPYVRYLFDNDVTGKEHSINKVKDGKKTFLWNKYLDEIGLRDCKIKDMNDLVIELYKNRNRVKFDADRFNSCFSDNELDAVYI